MTHEELTKISEKQNELKDLPNNELVEIMDALSSEFELTKENIIKLTYYIDNIEYLYNNVLKEYQNRK
jgi:hypothetical protein